MGPSVNISASPCSAPQSPQERPIAPGCRCGGVVKCQPTARARAGEAVLPFGQPRQIAAAQVAGAQRFMLQRAAHRFKDRAPVEGKLFLGRVKDLDQHALHPPVGGLRERGLDGGEIAQEIRQEHRRGHG